MKELRENELELMVGGLTLVTGLNNLKNGTNEVIAPAAAIKGALNAFGKVRNNVGDLSNIDVRP